MCIRGSLMRVNMPNPQMLNICGVRFGKHSVAVVSRVRFVMRRWQLPQNCYVFCVRPCAAMDATLQAASFPHHHDVVSEIRIQMHVCPLSMIAARPMPNNPTTTLCSVIQSTPYAFELLRRYCFAGANAHSEHINSRATPRQRKWHEKRARKVCKHP